MQTPKIWSLHSFHPASALIFMLEIFQKISQQGPIFSDIIIKVLNDLTRYVFHDVYLQILMYKLRLIEPFY